MRNQDNKTKSNIRGEVAKIISTFKPTDGLFMMEFYSEFKLLGTQDGPDFVRLVNKFGGVSPVARNLLVLYHTGCIDEETLINYYVVLTAMHFASSNIKIVYDSVNKPGNRQPHYNNFTFLCGIPAQAKQDSTLEAIIINEVANLRTSQQWPFLSYYAYYRRPFSVLSFSKLKESLEKCGANVSIPDIKFERFSPEEILRGLRAGRRVINFPPLHAVSYDNSINFPGKVHGCVATWFGVLLHDFFHWRIESRSSTELQCFRVSIVDYARKISGNDKLLTKFLWNVVIDFVHSVRGSFLLKPIDYLMYVFGGGLFGSFRGFDEPCFEEALCLLVASDEDIRQLGERREFSVGLIDSINRARALVFLGDDDSLKIRAVYLWLRYKQIFSRDVVELSKSELSYIQSIEELDLSHKHDGGRFLAVLGGFQKNPDTRELDVSITRPVVTVQNKNVANSSFWSRGGCCFGAVQNAGSHTSALPEGSEKEWGRACPSSCVVQ